MVRAPAVSAHTSHDSQNAPRPPSRAMQYFFGVAYGLGVAAALTSAALTAVYVAGGARELNPVVGHLLSTVGPVAAVPLKVAVVVACFWAYAWASRFVGSADRWTAFVWVGTLIQLVDAIHDVVVAVQAGPPSLALDVVALSVVVAVSALAAAVLRPTLPATRRWE